MMKVTSQSSATLFSNILDSQKTVTNETQETFLISELIKQSLKTNAEAKKVNKKQKLREAYGIDKLKINFILNPNVDQMDNCNVVQTEEILGNKFMMENVMKNILEKKPSHL